MSLKSISLAEAERMNWPTFSVAESREVDRAAIEQFHIPGIDLMRNAGRACADCLLEELRTSDPPTMILAGAGNNGGDGYVIAKCLAAAGRPVFVVSVIDTGKLRGDAKQSHDDAVDAEVPIEVAGQAQITTRIEQHDGMIVDCLLGTGSKGAPREPFAEAIRAANRLLERDRDRGRRVAIDIPSGLDGDTGEPFDPTFRADLTLTFVAPKTGMKNPKAAAYLGELEVIDIGIPDELKRQLRLPG
ncbi:NAD(P)H-hydrate epimerase [Aporhodopirellula aestuarii]|uniref:NAD(P)H-hydrate epimerase n=1 Tax=Aporhodopirellula aestuarii TaxID=2950107 RepID=A0ABT0U8N9_9BACT|nr:NAD(P)H-hydrate epimerase [Aporhodopirellula aestuarii]MCM2373146.1 NAD(P)H-hydrate epimerase [Aporhodopirellula aestuarii]